MRVSVTLPDDLLGSHFAGRRRSRDLPPDMETLPIEEVTPMLPTMLRQRSG